MKKEIYTCDRCSAELGSNPPYHANILTHDQYTNVIGGFNGIWVHLCKDCLFDLIGEDLKEILDNK